jgi:hypothetical protein
VRRGRSIEEVGGTKTPPDGSPIRRSPGDVRVSYSVRGKTLRGRHKEGRLESLPCYLILNDLERLPAVVDRRDHAAQMRLQGLPATIASRDGRVERLACCSCSVEGNVLIEIVEVGPIGIVVEGLGGSTICENDGAFHATIRRVRPSLRLCPDRSLRSTKCRACVSYTTQLISVFGWKTFSDSENLTLSGNSFLKVDPLATPCPARCHSMRPGSA